MGFFLIFHAVHSGTMKQPFPAMPNIHFLASLLAPVCGLGATHRLVWFLPWASVGPSLQVRKPQGSQEG